MQTVSRGAVIITTVVIVLVAVASGPLVSGLDLTADKTGTANYGGGSVTVTDVSIPDDGFVIRQGNYGSAAYFLETPDTTLTVDSVTGSPRLVYKLRIPAQNYVVAKTTFLRNDASGRAAISGPSDTFKPSAINQMTYRGEVRILIRSGMESRLLATKNVTIKVAG